VIAVPVPPLVADAGPSNAGVERFVKWFTASAAVLWQNVQGTWCWGRLWLAEVGPLNCGVAGIGTVWQLAHCVFTSSAPVCQLGVACPPWQLTFEQLSAAELSNDDAPVLASYVAVNAASPGATRLFARS
jgi:hypothetical protein